MVHILTLHVVPFNKAAAFRTAFGPNGLWRNLQPEMLGIDLLSSQSTPTLFVAIELWPSREAHLTAQNSPSWPTLLRFRQSLTLVSIDLGSYFLTPLLQL